MTGPLWLDQIADVLHTWRERVLVRSVEDTVWTGRDLAGRIGGAARVLDDAGCRAGQVVPALVTTRPQSLALVVAGAATGRPLAPLSPRLTVHELARCVAEADSPVLLCEPEWREVGHALARECGRELFLVDEFRPAEVPALSAPPDAVAFVLHTSGTTGVSRRVMVRQDRMGARSVLSGRLMRLDPESVFHVSSPFHHIGGLGNIAVAMACGSTVVTAPQFSVEAWQRLSRLGVTHAQSVPTIIEILLRANAFAVPTMRLLQYGSAPIHPDTLRRAMLAMPGMDFVNLYGQTEGAPLTCLSPEDHRLAAAGDDRLLGSVGSPVAGVELVVHEPDESGVGEVLVRGAHLFAPAKDGWLHTGDLGRLSAGRLYLVGRKGDLIIRGGENVYPTEVEQILGRHGGIVEAAVVGMPDARMGEVVKAFVVPSDPANPPDPQALRAFARTSLAGFKVPESWEFVSALPRNPAGKVLRRQLRMENR
jgi:acyl-CoA synthetase (AMP-forming)/AMP-acid ligase II